jgi:DNA-binding NarL/FixJ family response regulator
VTDFRARGSRGTVDLEVAVVLWYETVGGGVLKVVVFSRRYGSGQVGLHPAIERAFDTIRLAFDSESLAVALRDGLPEIVWVGYFSVPQFLENERGCALEIPDDVRCIVGTMKSAELVEVDARDFGFAGAISVSGSISATDILADVESLRDSTSNSRSVRRSSNLAHARRTFGVLYVDQIDFDIGRFVSMGIADRDIASLVHAAPQTVRNRISAILERSRLVNRTDLAVHHRDFAVKLWETGEDGHWAERTSVR